MPTTGGGGSFNGVGPAQRARARGISIDGGGRGKTGDLPGATVQYCRATYGLDVSQAMLKKARARCRDLRNVRFRKLPRSLRFPLAARTVDFAYFYHVSEHLEREDTFTILSEIRRVLKARGRALVQFSLLDHRDNQREFRKWSREKIGKAFDLVSTPKPRPSSSWAWQISTLRSGYTFRASSP
jgi:ubiquinone/menaquinone biosynthesis C-methylase UbiE